MTPVRIPACLLAALLSVLTLPGAAAPFTVRLGLERLVLDTPPGFTDTTELASPRLQDLSETLTAASNRILIFALSDADVRNFTLGEQLDAARYMIAVTPKGLERQHVPPSQFAALVADSLAELGKPEQPADIVKFLESQPIGKLNLIAELRREATVVSVLQATRLPPLPPATLWADRKPQYQYSTTTLLLLRGKALRLGVYTLFRGQADVDWLVAITQRWVDELQRLNSR